MFFKLNVWIFYIFAHTVQHQLVPDIFVNVDTDGYSYVATQIPGKDFFNNPYIYRALSWERPTSAGKLVMLILFVLCPCFNCLFWFLIWARRRVLVAAKTPSVLS